MYNNNGPTLLCTSYFPNIQYITKILHHKNTLIDIHETYQKQSYRNRCTILGANGLLNLTIPVIKQFGNKTKTKDILIDYSTNWQHVHWKAISSAYGNSPFFEIFEPEIVHLFERQIKYLIDFNEKSLCQLFQSLGYDLDLKYTTSYYQPNEVAFDFRDSIHPKARMQKSDSNFVPARYYQVFEDKFGFKQNLSFIDLMFNEGSEAIDKCKDSFKHNPDIS